MTSSIIAFRPSIYRLSQNFFKRCLHTRLSATDQKIAFISHSGACVLHWALHESPIKEKNKAIEKLQVFYRAPWFCDIHASHNENLWGQSPIELPKYIQKIFFERLGLKHDINSPITFKQNEQLHNCIIEDIQKRISNRFVHVKENITWISKIDNGYEIEVDGKKYNLKESAFFFNWLRSPREHKWENAIKNNYISKLYQLSKDFFASQQIKNVIIQGASPGIPWIFRDFEDMGCIAMIKRKGERIPEIPRNGDLIKKYIKSRRLLIFLYDEKTGKIVTAGKKEECRFRNLDPSGYVMELAYKDFTGRTQTFIGYFFVAIGNELDPITRIIPKKDKEECIDKSASTHWVAPKNIPAGSLTANYQYWLKQAGYTDYFYELQTYYNNDTLFRSVLLSRFLNGGIMHQYISNTFNPAIDKAIKNQKTCLSDKDFYSFFRETFHVELREPLGEHIQAYLEAPKNRTGRPTNKF